MTSIPIEDNNLQGTIPVELKELTFLRFLFLEGETDEDQEGHDYDPSTDYITGTIPSELGSLEDLQTLNLNFNKLSGTVSKSSFCVIFLELCCAPTEPYQIFSSISASLHTAHTT